MEKAVYCDTFTNELYFTTRITVVVTMERWDILYVEKKFRHHFTSENYGNCVYGISFCVWEPNNITVNKHVLI